MRLSHMLLAAVFACTGCGLEDEFDCPITTHTSDPSEAFLVAPWAAWEVPLALYVAPSFVASCGFNSLEKAKAFWHGYFFVVGERANSQVTLEYTEDQAAYDPIEPDAIGITKQGTSRTGYGRQRIMRKAETIVRSCDWRVLAHELGHALGYDHSLVPGNMMYISVNIVDNPTMTSAEKQLLTYSCE
jgi:Matrixin